MQLIFEKSVEGRAGFVLPPCDVPIDAQVPASVERRGAVPLPEVSELDVVRHYTNLSRQNYSVDTHFYPLGSCTMKYNPKFTETIAAMDAFTQLHPLMPHINEQYAQGALEVLYEMQQLLCEITGMAAFTLQPLAGAHGELTGVMIIAAYHKHKAAKKKTILVPDSSHGTNPASAALAGYEVRVVPTDKEGFMDMRAYAEMLTDTVAAVMLTCPDTLGIFNPRIKQIADMAHAAGALMYYDGANLNAMMGKCRPGDIGFDVMHINLHKTFATPHGGGGPGAGPVGVCEKLADYLPIPHIVKGADTAYRLDYERPNSIGPIAPFYGNFLVVLKAYAYIRALGRYGLIDASEKAVLNANYCRAKLKKYYDIAYDTVCMHECVFSASRQALQGVHALDIAKYLIDRGFHPPTIYFPLIVKEALMIEPTETESKETLDTFINTMIEIARLSKADPQKIKDAPVQMPVGRLDETRAARELDVRWSTRPQKK